MVNVGPLFKMVETKIGMTSALTKIVAQRLPIVTATIGRQRTLPRLRSRPDSQLRVVRRREHPP